MPKKTKRAKLHAQASRHSHGATPLVKAMASLPANEQEFGYKINLPTPKSTQRVSTTVQDYKGVTLDLRRTLFWAAVIIIAEIALSMYLK